MIDSAGGRARSLWAISFFLVVCVSHRLVAQAPSTTISIGETSAGAAPQLLPVFQRALEDSLAQLEGIRIARDHHASFVVRGSVTRLDSTRERDGARVDCEVSLFVAERHGGAVRLVLNGRARTMGASINELESTAVRSAVRSALRPLAQHIASR